MKTLIIATLVVLCGCTATKSLTYSDQTVYQGTGGACENRDGIDLWWSGIPPRKYVIIGFIVQMGLSTPMSDAILVREAKAKGGDGILRGQKTRDQLGTYSSGNGFVSTYGNTATITGSSVSTAIVRRESQYFIIKYL
jgi:hypothetical protein